MTAQYENDENLHIQEYRRKENTSSWFAPLLLLPIAFLAGWAINGYMANGQFNQPLPEVGVGGGPDNSRIVSPLPSNATISPTRTPIVSPTVSPTIAPTSGDTLVQ